MVAPSWVILGASWIHCEPCLGHLELFEAVLGHGGAHLGTHFGATWAILGYLRPSWAILELEEAKMR